MIKSEHGKVIITSSPIATSLGYSLEATVFADLSATCRVIRDKFGEDVLANMLAMIVEDIDKKGKK